MVYKLLENLLVPGLKKDLREYKRLMDYWNDLPPNMMLIEMAAGIDDLGRRINSKRKIFRSFILGSLCTLLTSGAVVIGKSMKSSARAEVLEDYLQSDAFRELCAKPGIYDFDINLYLEKREHGK